jgi:hypothetical protein
MATDAITLQMQGLMYIGQTPPQWQMMKLALLQQILLNFNPMAATDPASLLNIAQPYQCLGPQNWQLMELALLAQIANSTNASTGGGVSCGNGSPSGVIHPTSSCSLYIQLDSMPPGLIWEYYNGAWH